MRGAILIFFKCPSNLFFFGGGAWCNMKSRNSDTDQVAYVLHSIVDKLQFLTSRLDMLNFGDLSNSFPFFTTGDP